MNSPLTGAPSIISYLAIVSFSVYVFGPKKRKIIFKNIFNRCISPIKTIDKKNRSMRQWGMNKRLNDRLLPNPA